MGNRNNTIFLGNQILNRQVMGRIGNLCFAIIPELFDEFFKLFAYHLLEPVGVAEDFQIIGNFGNLVGVLLKQLLVLQTRQPVQPQIQNRLRLRG